MLRIINLTAAPLYHRLKMKEDPKEAIDFVSRQINHTRCHPYELKALSVIASSSD